MEGLILNVDIVVVGSRLDASPAMAAFAERLGRRSAAFDAPLPELATSPFVIRLPDGAWDAVCPLCGEEFPARGPTGFRGPEPVCDHCMLIEEPQLGMVLALVAVARMHAAEWPASHREELALQAELLAFARIYDRFASRVGPPRPVVDGARRGPTDG